MNFRNQFIRIFAALLILFANQQIGFATEKDAAVIQIFTLIYNQKFTEAEKALQSQNNLIEPFFHNILKLDLYWWKYSLSRSNEDAHHLKKVLAGFHNSTGNLPEEQINEVIRLSYQMRYEVKRYNLIAAYFLRTDIREKIESLKMQDLSFLGNRQQLFGLYVTLFDSFESSFNPLSSGNKSERFSKSVAALEIYSHSGDLIVSTLAHYFLGRIYTKVEKKPEKGLEHFKILAKRFPENVLFSQLSQGLNPRF